MKNRYSQARRWLGRYSMRIRLIPRSSLPERKCKVLLSKVYYVFAKARREFFHRLVTLRMKRKLILNCSVNWCRVFCRVSSMQFFFQETLVTEKPLF